MCGERLRVSHVPLLLFLPSPTWWLEIPALGSGSKNGLESPIRIEAHTGEGAHSKEQKICHSPDSLRVHVLFNSMFIIISLKACHKWMGDGERSSVTEILWAFSHAHYLNLLSISINKGAVEAVQVTCFHWWFFPKMHFWPEIRLFVSLTIVLTIRLLYRGYEKRYCTYTFLAGICSEWERRKE